MKTPEGTFKSVAETFYRPACCCMPRVSKLVLGGSMKNAATHPEGETVAAMFTTNITCSQTAASLLSEDRAAPHFFLSAVWDHWFYTAWSVSPKRATSEALIISDNNVLSDLCAESLSFSPLDEDSEHQRPSLPAWTLLSSPIPWNC